MPAGAPAPRARAAAPAAPAATAVVAATTAAAVEPVAAAPQPGRAKGASHAARKAAHDQLPLVVRILIWVVAFPIALALVGLPAKRAGYLTNQKLLDVVIKHEIDRFVPLLVIVLLWALVTAILVHLLVEGGRWYMLRRRADRDAEPAAKVVSSAPGAAPPPRRRSGAASGNGDGHAANGRAQPPGRAASRGRS